MPYLKILIFVCSKTVVNILINILTSKNIFLDGTQKIIQKEHVLLIVAKKETVTVILQIEWIFINIYIII